MVFLLVGETTYVARTTILLFEGKLPCIVIPSTGIASLAYNGIEYKVTEYEVLVCLDPEILFWVQSSCSSLPPLAVGVGNAHYYRCNGEEMYVARTCSGSFKNIKGSMTNARKKVTKSESLMCSLVGRLHSHYRGLYVPYEGKEYIVKTYEVLCAYIPPPTVHSCPNEWTWIKVLNGEIPEGALAGGTTASGEVTYVARAQHIWENLRLCGQFIPSERKCLICLGGKAHMKNTFEVLVVDDKDGFVWELASNGDLPKDAVLSQLKHFHPLEGVGRTITYSDISVGFTADMRRLPLPCKGSNANIQLIGRVSVGRWVMYAPYEGLEYIYREYEALRALSSPNTLKELCRYVILASTNAVPDRISSLPLPEGLKVFCQLREDEWNNCTKLN